MEPAAPNAEQAKLWNQVSGPKWVEFQDVLDRQIEHIGRLAMDAIPVVAGLRVLDVGCGCGATSMELSRRVGLDGRVLGVDISEPMLARARERAAERGESAHPTFVKADAQTYEFEAHGFDAAFSRFGVMFFDDPAGAFANLRAALRPDGVFAFVCWQSLDRNDWAFIPAKAVTTVVPPPPKPDPHAPGPFALADGDRTRSLLEKAGFSDVSLTAHETYMIVGASSDLEMAVGMATTMGPAGAALREADAATMDRARAAVRAVIAPFATSEGIRMPARVWVVRAVA